MCGLLICVTWISAALQVFPGLCRVGVWSRLQYQGFLTDNHMNLIQTYLHSKASHPFTLHKVSRHSNVGIVIIHPLITGQLVLDYPAVPLHGMGRFSHVPYHMLPMSAAAH